MLVCDYVLTMKFLSTKITINFWAVVLLASCLNAAVVVETRDEQVQNTSQTLLRLRAFNGTGDTLRNVEFRYFLAAKPSPAVLEKYYLPGADATIDSSSLTGAVVKISVPIFAPGVFPDSGGLSLGLHFPDWSDFEKGKDFSSPESGQFAQTEKVAVYVDGEFLQGILPGTLPDASPVSLVDGAGVSLSPGEKVHFAWREVDGAKSYRLNVFSAADTSIVLRRETEETKADVALDSGEYLWRVESSEYGLGSVAWNEKVKLLDDLVWRRLSVFADTTWIAERHLNVTPLAARKDTRLLDVAWGEMAVAREWDKPHWNHPHYDEEEWYRCWAVGAQMLNRYYGGDLTQDELKLNFKTTFALKSLNDLAANKILGAFLHYNRGGMADSLLTSVVLWALGNDVKLVREDSLPTEDEVRTWIGAGIPLYVWTEGHVMLLDAYRISLSGRMDVRVLNTDNDGTAEWRVLKSSALKGFVAATVSGNVRESDSRIHTDSDGDGLMDYDEIERFGTDPYNPDSDGDGIDDKTEIFSYTIREKLNGPIGNMRRGVEEEHYADIDGDGLRAEMDFDSDGGGVADGVEDANRNGIWESGETDVYDTDDDSARDEDSLDVPGKIILYAIGNLRINDGVKCFTEVEYELHETRNYYCAVASELKDSSYSVKLGRSATVGNVYSKGGVWLRNHATINRYVRFYSLPKQEYFPSLQKESNINSGYFSTLESLWPYKVANLPEMPNVGDSTMEVAYGEQFTLRNGEKLKSLKVHPGGILHIAPGVMYVGKLQLESGSKVRFVNPGRRTVLHLDGGVVWRSINLNDDLERVAKGFLLVQHRDETMIVEGMWAGTIFAPNADLVLGQSSKKLYGRFLGKNVTVHQYAQVYSVPFNPEMKTVIAGRGR